ncbi:MAG: RNA polymerase sigma factor [Solirubrobacteraceae bacterium]
MIRPFRRHPSLLRRAQADPAAFADFYDAYSHRVLRFFARRVVDGEASFDLMSETFATALSQMHQFRGSVPEEEQGWLFAIARSELSHYWRRGAVERTALARIGVPVPALTSAEIERIEELAGIAALAPRLAEAMGGLPEDQRQAISLRVIKELDYSEISAVLGISEEAVRARVSRGLRKMARGLTAAREEESDRDLSPPPTFVEKTG